jgi:hypothetical protein
MAHEFDGRVAEKDAIIERLAHIFGGDVALARTVYAYAVLGHFSHHGYLRQRLSAVCGGAENG